MFSSKILRFILLFLTVAGLAAAVAFADTGQDGKLLYRTNCKVCHDKGSPNGQYSPMTLTQDQWRRFFSSKLIPAHKTVVEPKSGKKLLEELSPAQLKSIQRFCIDHAADSEQPATCG
jgi:mono/diheme cytochrome c family protein